MPSLVNRATNSFNPGFQMYDTRKKRKRKTERIFYNMLFECSEYCILL